MSIAIDPPNRALTGRYRAGAPQALLSDPYERDRAGVFGHPNYDVTPDGERFVMVQRDPVASR